MPPATWSPGINSSRRPAPGCPGRSAYRTRADRPDVSRVLLAVALAALVMAVAAVVRRRRVVDQPSQPAWVVPAQLDRRDFGQPGVPWLVVVFSSATCSTCAAMVAKAAVLASGEVAVD